MKFGIVVNVCTTLLKAVFLISERKIANTIGTQLVAIPRPLIASVFFTTRTTSFLVAAVLKSDLNHFKPTNLSQESVSPDL